MLAVLVAGLWVRLAPAVTGRITDGGAVIDGADAPALFGREAVLAVLLAASGVLLGVVVAVRYRSTLLPSALMLAAAGLLGAVLAWRLGVALGPDTPADPRTLPTGRRFAVPLALDAPGVLCMWAIASLAVVLVLDAWLPRAPAHRSADGVSQGG